MVNAYELKLYELCNVVGAKMYLLIINIWAPPYASEFRNEIWTKVFFYFLVQNIIRAFVLEIRNLEIIYIMKKHRPDWKRKILKVVGVFCVFIINLLYSSSGIFDARWVAKMNRNTQTLYYLCFRWKHWL